MGLKGTNSTRSTLLLVPVIGLILLVSVANGQTIASDSVQEEIAKASAANSPESDRATATVPVFADYRGIKIGMSAAEVRTKLDNLKQKGKVQDFFVFSEQEAAQIFYDEAGKVTAISVDYFGENSKAPSPNMILGAELEAKADGSMYQLKRYPDAGYWVSYNRTAGDKPIVTITMQKF